MTQSDYKPKQSEFANVFLTPEQKLKLRAQEEQNRKFKEEVKAMIPYYLQRKKGKS